MNWSHMLPAERVERSLNGVLCVDPDGKSRNGWLVLTDQRLVFIATGAFDTRHYAERQNFELGLKREKSFAIPLADIVDIEPVSRMGPDVLMISWMEDRHFRYVGFSRVRMNWKEWAEAINSTRAGARRVEAEVGEPKKFPRIERTEEEITPPEPSGVASLRTRVEKFLNEVFGKYVTDPETRGYLVQHGSTQVVVVPHEERAATLVNIIGVVAINVNLTRDLNKFLNDLNAKIVFGKFVVIEENRLVLFQEGLLGDKMDREELEIAVATVAATADKYDDEIVEKFGGFRFIDVQSR